LLFRITFRGALDESWFAILQGMTLSTTRERGVTETTLVGEAPDEAAIVGIVNMLYELGCSLLEVKRMDAGAPDDSGIDCA
jgi:hypothetical protein